MSRPWLYVMLGVLALVGLGMAGFLATFERRLVTVPVPARGEARYNRFLALQQTLTRLHVPASSVTAVPRWLRQYDTLVLGDDVSRIEPDEARRLVAWVRAGGHLVLAAPVAAVRDVPLLAALHLLDARVPSFDCVVLQSDAAPADGGAVSQLCGARFRLDPQALGRTTATIGDARAGLAFAQVAEGAGTVSVLSDLGVISHQALRRPGAQQFAWRLLAPDRGRGHVYLAYVLDGPSFWARLLMRGWPALLASLLLLAGWMARRSERLGPSMPAPAVHRRALLEHVQAAGEFLFRRDAGRSLHRLACHATLARLQRRDPASAALQDADLYAWLGERSRLDPARIAHAFQPPANASAFRDCIVTLARLRSRP